MTDLHDRSDLPIALGGEDLPIPVANAQPRHERATALAYPAWATHASQRHVRDLAMASRQGDIWLATGGGVLHWWPDLERFTRYGSEHGLPGNAAMAIAVDGKKRVWVGCGDRLGLYYLEQGLWQPYTPLGALTICRLTTDSSGRLWVSTTDGTFGIDQPDAAPVVTLPTPGDPPRVIAAVDDTDLWLCNAQGIHRRDGDGWVRQSEYVRPEILKLARQGQYLWVATFYGLERVDLDTGEVYRSEQWPAGEVTALAPATNGLWMACRGQVGLATENDWRPLKKLPVDAPIVALGAGSEDEVWIGSHSGLWRGDFSDIQFQSSQAAPDDIGLPVGNKPSATFSNMVQALAIPQQNRPELWMGTAQGLFRWNLVTDVWRRQGQLGQDIRAVVTDGQGEIWVASWTEGLSCLTAEGVVDGAPKLPDLDLVLAMAPNPDGGYWVVGMNGLYQHQGQQWKLVLPAKALKTGWIQAIAQAESDHVWVGTSAGLFRYLPSKNDLQPVPGDISSADIRTLLALPKRPLLVGTQRGLYWGKAKQWHQVNTLARRAITALVWDAQAKKLWVGTDLGLYRLKPTQQTWEVVDEFTVQTSGLAGNHILALALGPNPNGSSNLWIGTPCGLNCFSY
jgi:ligand-binding sensor domain-containing protein